jgi:hypothetical protein
MSWFDWVPTPIEVIKWGMCRISDHEWVETDDGVVCSICGKVRE